jgi:hypothetical protein
MQYIIYPTTHCEEHWHVWHKGSISSFLVRFTVVFSANPGDLFLLQTHHIARRPVQHKSVQSYSDIHGHQRRNTT